MEGLGLFVLVSKSAAFKNKEPIIFWFFYLHNFKLKNAENQKKIELPEFEKTDIHDILRWESLEKFVFVPKYV